MIAPEKVSLSDFVTRRLNPTKVTLAYLRHESSVHVAGTNVQIDRQELASVIATLELFIEDYEKLVTREPRPAGAIPVPERTPSYVSDLGSTNGIVVDNQHVTQAPLRDGSVIHLGTTTIIFRQQG